jgi:hypothetical protein
VTKGKNDAEEALFSSVLVAVSHGMLIKECQFSIRVMEE